jgi:hypothetical protein
MLPQTILVTACLFPGFPGFVEVEVPSSAVERLRQEGIWMRKETEKLQRLRQREFEDINRRLQEIFDQNSEIKIQERKIILPPGPTRKRNHA